VWQQLSFIYISTFVMPTSPRSPLSQSPTAERSVIGQLLGYYWLLKIAPFHSGFHPYPIITATVAAAVDDASMVMMR